MKEKRGLPPSTKAGAQSRKGELSSPMDAIGWLGSFGREVVIDQTQRDRDQRERAYWKYHEDRAAEYA